MTMFDSVSRRAAAAAFWRLLLRDRFDDAVRYRRGARRSAAASSGSSSVNVEFLLSWDAEILDAPATHRRRHRAGDRGAGDSDHYYVIDKLIFNAFNLADWLHLSSTGTLAAMRRRARLVSPTKSPTSSGHYERRSAERFGTIRDRGDHPVRARNVVFAARCAAESYELVFSGDGGGGRRLLMIYLRLDLVRPAGPARRDAADRGRGAFHAVDAPNRCAPSAHPRRGSAPWRTASACPPAKLINPGPTPAGTGSARYSSPWTSPGGPCASSASGPARATRSTLTCSGSSTRAAATRLQPPRNFAGPSPRRPGRPVTRSISAPRSGRSGTPPARAPKSSGRCGSGRQRQFDGAFRPRGDRPLRGPRRRSARAIRARRRVGPPLAEAHYQYALALSGTARLGEADFHFARAAGLRGDYAGGFASYRRARGLLGTDPAWAARIDAALSHME